MFKASFTYTDEAKQQAILEMEHSSDLFVRNVSIAHLGKLVGIGNMMI